MNPSIQHSKRIVIKIGSALVTDEATGDVRRDWLAALCDDVLRLKALGKEVVLVSSGAIALGRKTAGIETSKRPGGISLDLKQAAAAIGQIALSGAYSKYFSERGIIAAQILLTRGDTEDRRRFLNARSTFRTLLEKGAVPVVNENDTVATSEIKYGDNDRLAARVAQMIEADLLIQLSTTDGLYTADPRIDDTAEHVPVVEKIDDVAAMAGDALPGVSTGGMKSKIDAARLCVDAGIPMIITRGICDHALRDLIEGEARHTLFKESARHGSAWKRWIQGSVKPAGTFTIDAGAETALHSGKSLLPAGVKAVFGTFARGDVVSVENESGQEIARGLSAYDSADAAKIIGKKSAEIEGILGYIGRAEMIHRDDMALRA